MDPDPDFSDPDNVPIRIQIRKKIPIRIRTKRTRIRNTVSKLPLALHFIWPYLTKTNRSSGMLIPEVTGYSHQQVEDGDDILGMNGFNADQ